jgi:metal-responsive CopG/Arc/MetJ family transcriptional regulator
MNHTKVMSLRMPAELAAQIDAVARTEGVSISETMRAAAYRYIASRRADHDFQERLKKRLEEDREVLELLAEQGTA